MELSMGAEATTSGPWVQWNNRPAIGPKMA